MNPILLVRLLFSLRDYQKRINQEADEFDQKHDIVDSPTTKKMSHLMIGVKVILTAMVLGDLPIDFLDLSGISAKLGWMGVLLVSGVLLFGFLALMAIQEKDDRRAEVQKKR
jgi:hypothetical protein